jgi:hypothetical protein
LSIVMPLSRRAPLTLVAAAVLILNLADAVFTLVYLHVGMAEEGNPVMGSALTHGPVGFMAIKLALVSLGVLLLFRLRARRAASIALVGSAVAYGSLLVFHLTAVPQLVALAQS